MIERDLQANIKYNNYFLLTFLVSLCLLTCKFSFLYDSSSVDVNTLLQPCSNSVSWSPGLKQQSMHRYPDTFLTILRVAGLQSSFSFFLASLIVTGVKNTIGRHNGVDKTYGRGLEDEAAVGSFSCKNYSRLCQCDFHSVSHCCLYIEASAAVLVSSVSPNCFLEEGR